MSYRPYPNVDRALSQLDRHYSTAAAPQPSGLQLRLAEQATAAMERAARTIEPFAQAFRPHFPVGDYRLNTKTA
ncbi:hypothetical protein ACGFZR_15305 [Streptomyces sp. NPDC048241]|uniref:hypothetical protein n=1 Tax=Streptomyces sp. NPDC048241 TaxID=3365521 RepID=UPI003720B89B